MEFLIALILCFSIAAVLFKIGLVLERKSPRLGLRIAKPERTAAQELAWSRKERLRIEHEAMAAWEDRFDPERHVRARRSVTTVAALSYGVPTQTLFDQWVAHHSGGEGGALSQLLAECDRNTDRARCYQLVDRMARGSSRFRERTSMPPPGSLYESYFQAKPATYAQVNEELAHAAYMDMMKKSSTVYRA